MRVFFRLYTTLMVLFLLTASHAFAFRCGTEFVSVGDTQMEVLEKCGEPDWVDSRYGPIPPELRQQGVPFSARVEPRIVEVDQWHYNLGPHRFIRILQFDQGVLTRIETGGYGY